MLQQLVPLLVERKRPEPVVPAKRFVSNAVRANTRILVNPLLDMVQLVPLFVERKTPSPSVPAKRLVPPTPLEETDRERTKEFAGGIELF